MPEAFIQKTGEFFVTKRVPVLLFLALINVACSPNQIISSITPNPIISPTTTATLFLKTIHLPTDVPVEATPIGAPLPTQKPTKEITVAPTHEPISMVAPGDVLMATVESDSTKTWTIIRGTNDRQQISPDAALVLQEKGAIIPPWFTKDLTTQFLLNANSRQVIGGLIKSSPSTYITVCSYDQKAGAFSWPPAVHWDGQYVAVVQEGNRLRLCDFPPHHEGVFYAFPPGWEINNIAFGAGQHKNDLLISVRTGPQKHALYWLINSMVTDFPDSVIADNHLAINLASEIKMRYLKEATPRLPKHKITPELLFESSNPIQAMPIWSAFP